jgi:hypothetical protein
MAQGIANYGLGTKNPTQSNTGISPYFMVFGSEAILPADVALKGPRVEHYDEKNSN